MPTDPTEKCANCGHERHTHAPGTGFNGYTGCLASPDTMTSLDGDWFCACERFRVSADTGVTP